MFRFACIDFLKNYQNSYNNYSINKPSITFPLLKNYSYTDNNKDYKFKQKDFRYILDDEKKLDKDYSKFSHFRYLKNNHTKDDDIKDDDDNSTKNNLAVFVLITLFTGTGIYLFRRTFYAQK